MFIETESEADNCILPDTSIVLSVRYRGHISMQENNLPGVVLSGIRKSAKNVHYAGQSGNLLVRFIPGGAAAFFSEPLNEVMDLSVSLAFLKNCSDISSLPDRLAACGTKEEKIARLEQMLVLLQHGRRAKVAPLVGRLGTTKAAKAAACAGQGGNGDV